MKTKTLFVFAIVGLLLIFPVNVLACACCSERDYYFSGPTDLEEYPLSQLKRMRFDRTANLFFSEAGIEEHSKGIEYVRENYSISNSLLNKVWKFALRSGTHSGELGLGLPEKLWDHSVDIHDNKISAGGGPLLYKEWRFEGDFIRGTGIFKAGFASPAKYRLILQGRGNACDNAEDFTNWRLEVRGATADYAFYGKLLEPVPNR